VVGFGAVRFLISSIGIGDSSTGAVSSFLFLFCLLLKSRISIIQGGSKMLPGTVAINRSVAIVLGPPKF
jgi:hypothetical protein